MEAKQLFESGDLAGAIQAATVQVKARPTDAIPRTFLFELLSFAGDLDRAQKHLDVIGQLDSQSEWAVQVYTNILHAERLRRRLFGDGLRPEFLLDPPAYVQLHLEAVNRLREGRPEEASEVLERAEELRPTVRGEVNDRPCDEIRDCDDLLAPFLEVILLRDYIWLPWEQIKEIEIAAPERPRDLIWLPARIVLVDGSQRSGYLPALYCGSHEHADDRVKLGRMTDWRQSEEGPVTGAGLHTLLAGDDALGVTALRRWQGVPA